MSDEAQNLATVQAIYEAFGKGDIPAILDRLADNVAWESWADNQAQAAGVSYMKARSGKEEAAEFFALTANMRVSEFAVLSLMAGGSNVAAEITIAACNPESGAAFRDEEMHLWTFDSEGRVARLRHYVDTAKHIAAAR